MPVQVNPKLVTYEAGEDLRNFQYRFVKLGSTENQVVKNEAGTAASRGILQNDPNTGEEALVAVPGGTAYLEASAAISLEAIIVPTTNGKGVTATPGAGVNAFAGAKALEAALADADIIVVDVVNDIYQGA